MGKGPRAPDPNAVVEAQKDANRLNTYTPYGATVFGSMDDAGQFVPRQGGDAVMSQETPFQKAQRERQQGFQNQLSGLAQSRLGSLIGNYSQGAPPGISDQILQGPDGWTGNQFDGWTSPDGIQNIISSSAGGPSGGGSNFGQNYRLPDSPAYQSSIDRSGFTPVRDYSGDVQRGYAGLDTSGLQGISAQGDFAGERQRIEDATFNRQKRLMDPGFQQSRERLAQDLANRGLPIGSEASNRALDRMDRSQGQAMADLTDRSVALGGQEFARRQEQQRQLRGQQFGERQAAFGAGQQQAGFANQATQLANAMAANSRGVQSAEALQDQQMSNAGRANQIREALATRNININEIGQLMGLSPQQPIPQMGGVAPIDAIGPAYQQYQGDLANYQSNVGAAGDLAGAGAAWWLRPTT